MRTGARRGGAPSVKWCHWGLWPPSPHVPERRWGPHPRTSELLRGPSGELLSGNMRDSMASADDWRRPRAG
eukprot:6223657-Alexandrium_andersonii.AAC.1